MGVYFHVFTNYSNFMRKYTYSGATMDLQNFLTLVIVANNVKL